MDCCILLFKSYLTSMFKPLGPNSVWRLFFSSSKNGCSHWATTVLAKCKKNSVEAVQKLLVLFWNIRNQLELITQSRTIVGKLIEGDNHRELICN